MFALLRGLDTSKRSMPTHHSHGATLTVAVQERAPEADNLANAGENGHELFLGGIVRYVANCVRVVLRESGCGECGGVVCRARGTYNLWLRVKGSKRETRYDSSHTQQRQEVSPRQMTQHMLDGRRGLRVSVCGEQEERHGTRARFHCHADITAHVRQARGLHSAKQGNTWHSR